MSIIPFEFESAKFVGDWNYDTKNKICSICSESLYKPAPAKNETPHFNYSVSMGECRHAFHRKCIKKYNRREKFCPLYNSGPCKGELFKFSKELETKGCVKLFKHN